MASWWVPSTFIVFWERDITSENHGTPVHLHIIVYTLSLLSVFTLSSTFISCIDPFETARPEELTTPLYALGAKLFVSVCRSTSSVVTPTCISWSPTGSILNLSIFAKGNLLLRFIKPSTWGNQQRELPLCNSSILQVDL